jgi:hypothetical protein
MVANMKFYIPCLAPALFMALSLVACEDVEKGCDCIPDDAPSGSESSWTAPSGPTCGKELCAIVQASEGELENEESGFMLVNPDALECALEALRDRSPGIVRWTWSDEYGQYSEDGYILVQPEGTAVHRSWGAQDLSWVAEDARAGELPDAQYYDDCLAQPDAQVRFDCLRDVVIEEPTICDEGWWISSI